MTLRGVLSSLALTGAAFALQGCVIAAAAPLAAAGVAVAKGKRDAPRAPAPAALASAPSTAAALPSSENTAVVLTGLTALPAPSARDIGVRDKTFLTFAQHALDRVEASPATADTRSAVLANPGAFDSERAACRARPAIVLIDLDPGRDAFDPLADSQTDPALVDALARLREQDVVIAWQTRLGENFAEAIRAALARTGLDPEGTDKLLVLSSLDERKQTRRDALAKTHCIVAILGDERADFDELYLYLKDREAVVPSDAIIGRGWFLATPIVSEG